MLMMFSLECIKAVLYTFEVGEEAQSKTELCVVDGKTMIRYNIQCCYPASTNNYLCVLGISVPLPEFEFSHLENDEIELDALQVFF